RLLPAKRRHRDLPCCPTRRSPELHLRPARDVHRTDAWVYLANLAYGVTTTRDPQTGSTDVLTYADLVRAGRMVGPRVYSTGPGRSEEHTSELQSRENLVCRLLLAK